MLIFSSGCGGNLNNFKSIQECESVCDILIQMARQANGNFDIHICLITTTLRKKNKIFNLEKLYLVSFIYGKNSHSYLKIMFFH